MEDREEYVKCFSLDELAKRERSAVPFHVIINPQLSVKDDTSLKFFEACSSLEGFWALVPRARAVQVKCLNEHGETRVIDACGWYARILQHEIDHLHGKLYIDRMDSRSFMTSGNRDRYWKGSSIEEIRAALMVAGQCSRQRREN
ncbi:MAG TPA: peptide deformylase [Verrucomicrobiae bacterium]|nr:peptide deformylase [Verrucomicrobiae bacterium]